MALFMKSVHDVDGNSLSFGCSLSRGYISVHSLLLMLSNISSKSLLDTLKVRYVGPYINYNFSHTVLILLLHTDIETHSILLKYVIPTYAWL